MLKRHTFWIKTATVLQLLTAAMHSLSFFNEPVAANDTEKQLVDLMSNYRMDLGAGFHPTMLDLFNSMSACYVLLLVFGAVVNWFLLRQKVDAGTLKGLVVIEMAVFGACFAVMAMLTFLPPIVLTGLVFTSLFAARMAFPKKQIAVNAT